MQFFHCLKVLVMMFWGNILLEVSNFPDGEFDMSEDVVQGVGMIDWIIMASTARGPDTL